MDQSVHYRKPGMLTRKLMNPFVVIMMRAGVSVWGSRILEVPGRTSGVPRRTPVNLLEFDGHRYLVSPRGEGQWVKNVRATTVGWHSSWVVAARSFPPANCLTARSRRYCVPICASGRWK